MEAHTPARRYGRAIGLIFLNIALAIGVHFAWSALARPADAALKPVAPAPISDEEKLIRITAKASPAVVSILVQEERMVAQPLVVSGDGHVSSQPAKKELIEIGKGTGFLVDANGLIVTNRHVAFQRDAILTVFLTDGRSFHAEIADIDPVNDLALLKIDAKGLAYLELEADDVLRIGQTTVAIGNALGKYANTVTSGVLSGLDRDVEASDSITGGTERLEELLQTDAAINSGNSGGPLLNLDGRVIGINTAVETDAQGLGFALPVSEIRKVLASYRRYGAIARPRLGVRYTTITPDIAVTRGLAYQYGALVEGDEAGNPAVVPQSPASAAGVMANDIILEVNGKKLEGKMTLSKAIQAFNVGDATQIKIARGGIILSLTIRFDAVPPYGR